MKKIAQVFPLLLEGVMMDNNSVLPEQKRYFEIVAINKNEKMQMFQQVYQTDDHFQENIIYIATGEEHRSACALCHEHKIDVETLIYLN